MLIKSTLFTYLRSLRVTLVGVRCLFYLCLLPFSLSKQQIAKCRNSNLKLGTSTIG